LRRTASLTCGASLSARETVLGVTPAIRATSMIVDLFEISPSDQWDKCLEYLFNAPGARFS
jgi:hypothetical protein